MLNEALRLMRVYHDRSLTELANQLGITKSYLSEIENNKKQPTLPLLEKYSTIFNIPLSSIMLFSESMNERSFPDRARVALSKKVLSILNFIAERSRAAEEVD